VRSWWLKVERAKAHIAELEEQVERLRNVSSTEVDLVGSGFVVQGALGGKVYSYAATAEILDVEADRRIATIIGDAAHNLRTALDHCAVAVAPPERDRVAEFPIFTDLPTGSRQQKFDSLVRGMPPEAIAVLTAAQPYMGGGRTHPLARLMELDNTDKHRQLHVVVNVFDLPVVGRQAPGTGRLPRKLLAQGTMAAPGTVVRIGKPTFAIILGPDEELGAISGLCWIGGEVSRILKLLEPFAP
jgi:hypothetical protein